MSQQQKQTPDVTRLWDAAETARYLGVHVKYLERDRAGKMKIPFLKIGKHVRYDPADVMAFKDRCKFGVFAEPKGSAS